MTQEKKDNKSERREPFMDKDMVAIGKVLRDLGYKHGALAHAATGEKIDPVDYEEQNRALREAYIEQVLRALDLAVKRKWMAPGAVLVVIINRLFPSEGGNGATNGSSGTPLLPVG